MSENKIDQNVAQMRVRNFLDQMLDYSMAGKFNEVLKASKKIREITLEERSKLVNKRMGLKNGN